MRRLLVTGLSLAVYGCASIKYSAVPGTTAAMTEYRLDELSFEMPAEWSKLEWSEGLTLSRCSRRDPPACLSVEVILTDRFARGCAEPADVAAGLFQGWRERWQGVQALPANVAGHQAWRFDDEATHSLVVCGGERSWVVRTSAFNVLLDRYAVAALDQFVQTARFHPERTPGD